MNEKIAKNKKAKKMSPKIIIFWSSLALIVLILLTILIVRVAQERDVTSYSSVDMLIGSDMYVQEEDSYYVLFYDFNNEKENETFDKTMYQYLTFVKANSSKDSAKKVYGMDTDENRNQFCFGSSTNIESTTTFPNKQQSSGTTVLQIKESDVPVLILVEAGKVTSYKSGENAILAYLQAEMKK